MPNNSSNPPGQSDVTALSSVANSRRYHHKSRRGCVSCKKRRIKCDEAKPTCSNCHKKLLSCSFSSLLPTIYASNTSTYFSDVDRYSQINLSLPRAPSQPMQFSFCRPNSSDLEFLHHYRSKTATSLSNQISVKKLLQEDILNLSSSFPFLGHALLSIACSHLALLSPDTASRTKLIADASWHLGVALPHYCEDLENITQNNCSALFAFATLMVLHTFVTASESFQGLLSAERDEASHLHLTQSLVDTAIIVTRSIRGIFFVFFRYKQWIVQSSFSSILQRHTKPILSGPQTSWATVEDNRLSMLEGLWQQDVSVNRRSSQALSDALHDLRGAFKMVTQLTVLSDADTAPAEVDLLEIHKQLLSGKLDDLPSAFTWQVSVSPEYLSLVERQDPYAIVLLAHYAILLDRACSRTWWIHKVPSQFVSTALLILGSERRLWIEWPINTVGLVCQMISTPCLQPLDS